jgi:hypothetical protein
MKIYQHYSIFGFSNSYIIGNEDLGKALVVDPAELTPTMIEKSSNTISISGHTHHPQPYTPINGLSTIMKIYSPTIYASNAKLLGFQCRKVKMATSSGKPATKSMPSRFRAFSRFNRILACGLFLFTGDVLHAGLIGKTSSAFNTTLSPHAYSRSSFLFRTYGHIPGHGPPSTIVTEKNANISYQEGFAEHIRSNL